MNDSNEAGELYLRRLDVLEHEIRRQREVLAEHGIGLRDRQSWEAVRARHDRWSSLHADHQHGIQRLMEDLRFDVDVLVQDFRRFFLSVDRDRSQKKIDAAR